MTENVTPNLGLRLLKYNQVQKEIIVNEALVVIDALLGRVALKIISSIEEAEKNGGLYVIGENSEAEWRNYSKGTLIFYCNGWRYIIPKKGWILWLIEKKKHIIFDGKEWDLIT